MKLKIIKKSNLFIFLLLPIVCIAQTSLKANVVLNESNIKDLIDSVANKMINKPMINSTSIAIVYQDKEYIGHYGELEKGKSNKPNNKTIYEIGSLSKTLTGTLIAKAVLDKKINLVDNIQKYLVGDYPNLKFSNYPILIKNLITHTSGLPNMLPLKANEVLKDFTNKNTDIKLNEILKNFNQKEFLKDLHTVKIDTIPGYKFSYSSAGIELLGLILEKVYHEKYENLLIEYFSKNVQMNDTKISLSKIEKENLAVGYHCDDNAITTEMPKFPWGSSGNIKTTVPDMMKYIKYQLKNNSEILESHKIVIKFDNKFSLGYCWQIITNEKLGTFYLHHGGVLRSQCFIYIIPKYDLGVFIITNQSGENTPKDMQEAINEIFEKIEENKNNG